MSSWSWHTWLSIVSTVILVCAVSYSVYWANTRPKYTAREAGLILWFGFALLIEAAKRDEWERMHRRCDDWTLWDNYILDRSWQLGGWFLRVWLQALSWPLHMISIVLMLTKGLIMGFRGPWDTVRAAVWDCSMEPVLAFIHAHLIWTAEILHDVMTGTHDKIEPWPQPQCYVHCTETHGCMYV